MPAQSLLQTSASLASWALALPTMDTQGMPRKDHNFRSEEVSGDAILYQTETAPPGVVREASSLENWGGSRTRHPDKQDSSES